MNFIYADFLSLSLPVRTLATRILRWYGSELTATSGCSWLLIELSTRGVIILINVMVIRRIFLNNIKSQNWMFLIS